MCPVINIKILRSIKGPVLLSFFQIFFFFVNSVNAQSYTFYASGTWTCPTGVTSVTVECWGAGGAGGSANGVAPKAGAGGAGGGYTIKNNYTVVPGNVYSVTVGKGGIGNAANTTTAPSGGNSLFNNDNSTVGRGGGGGGSNGGTAGAGQNGAPQNIMPEMVQPALQEHRLVAEEEVVLVLWLTGKMPAGVLAGRLFAVAVVQAAHQLQVLKRAQTELL